MSADLPERLRNQSSYLFPKQAESLMLEAAAEIERLRRQIPATFDNGICLVCGVAHKDTGMPCPGLTITSYSQSPAEKSHGK